MAARCLHSSAPLEQAVDELLRGARLGDQLVRFLPVVVDIDAARLEVLREGSLGLGVRASGALPGPFAPVLVRQTGPEGQVARRLVDGGVMDLVPVDTLYAEGAAVGIASQVLSPPLPRPPEGLTGRQGLRGGAERALKALDPARRLDDALRAAFLMMGRPVAARAAARFTVPSLGFNPLDWSRPQAILDALATSSEVQAQLGTVVREAEEAMRALQWRKGRAVQGGWSVVAEVSRDEE